MDPVIAPATSITSTLDGVVSDVYTTPIGAIVLAPIILTVFYLLRGTDRRASPGRGDRELIGESTRTGTFTFTVTNTTGRYVCEYMMIVGKRPLITSPSVAYATTDTAYQDTTDWTHHLHARQRSGPHGTDPRPGYRTYPRNPHLSLHLPLAISAINQIEEDQREFQIAIAGGNDRHAAHIHSGGDLGVRPGPAPLLPCLESSEAPPS